MIITLPANEKLRKVHNRMPAVLPADDIDKWLDATTDIGELKNILENNLLDDLFFY